MRSNPEAARSVYVVEKGGAGCLSLSALQINVIIKARDDKHRRESLRRISLESVEKIREEQTVSLRCFELQLL